MKKALYVVLCLLLAAGLCLSLTACAGRDVGGLGTLDMDDGDGDDIGALGDPTATGDKPESTPEATAAQTAAPTQAPATQAPAAMSTEKYECDNFSVTIPTGWQVKYDVIDSGTGEMRLYVYVRDPNNSHNCFFYLQALEPFFVSQSAKDAWLPYVEESIDYAPVLTNPSAEGVLSVWPSIYAVACAQGYSICEDYRLSKVIEAKDVDSSSASNKVSYVLANITMPDAAGGYTMFLQNTLKLMDPVSGLPADAKYYISYSNNGVILSDDVANSQFETLLQCLSSLSVGKASSGQGIGGSASLPQLTLPPHS